MWRVRETCWELPPRFSSPSNWKDRVALYWGEETMCGTVFGGTVNNLFLDVLSLSCLSNFQATSTVADSSLKLMAEVWDKCVNWGVISWLHGIVWELSDDGNQTCTGESLGPIKIKRAGRKGGTHKGVWKGLAHDVERRTRRLWYLETKWGECFQEEEELSRVECSRQVKENE